MDITIKNVDNRHMLILLSKLDKVNKTMNESVADKVYIFRGLDKLLSDLNDEVDDRYVTTLLFGMESEDEEEVRSVE